MIALWFDYTSFMKKPIILDTLLSVLSLKMCFHVFAEFSRLFSLLFFFFSFELCSHRTVTLRKLTWIEHEIKSPAWYSMVWRTWRKQWLTTHHTVFNCSPSSQAHKSRWGNHLDNNVFHCGLTPQEKNNNSNDLRSQHLCQEFLWNKSRYRRHCPLLLSFYSWLLQSLLILTSSKLRRMESNRDVQRDSRLNDKRTTTSIAFHNTWTRKEIAKQRGQKDITWTM